VQKLQHKPQQDVHGGRTNRILVKLEVRGALFPPSSGSCNLRALGNSRQDFRKLDEDTFAVTTLLGFDTLFWTLARPHAADIKVLSTRANVSILAELGNDSSVRKSCDSSPSSMVRHTQPESFEPTVSLPHHQRGFLLEDLRLPCPIANGTLVDIAASPRAFGVAPAQNRDGPQRSRSLIITCWGPRASHSPTRAAAAQDVPISSPLRYPRQWSDQVKPKNQAHNGRRCGGNNPSPRAPHTDVRRAVGAFSIRSRCADA